MYKVDALLLPRPSRGVQAQVKKTLKMVKFNSFGTNDIYITPSPARYLEFLHQGLFCLYISHLEFGISPPPQPMGNGGYAIARVCDEEMTQVYPNFQLWREMALYNTDCSKQDVKSQKDS